MSGLDDLVTVKFLFFAKAREFVGKRELFDEVPRKIRGRDLLDLISHKFNLNHLKCNVILTLNKHWLDLDSDIILREGYEIAIIPPLSGDKLCVDAIYKMVCSPEFGAVSLFVGTTRNHFEGKTVNKLEYEAYEQMAVESLQNLCQTIREKFDIGNIAIYHRLGEVPIQDESVVIAISSTHRQAALNAVPFAIDALKAEIPIWKKEIYDGQPSEWKQNSESKKVVFEPNPDAPHPVNLYEEIVEMDIANEVPPHLIQVRADLQEINRRINSFICRKREQINESNIKKFFPDSFSYSGDESTCARVTAVLKRRKDSKSHLKVHRVANVIGPQTHGMESTTANDPRLCLGEPRGPDLCPPGAEERIVNAENYLNVTKKSKDVFARLKALEDKIIFLESISPEYFDLKKDEHKSMFSKINFVPKRTYSSSELDAKMHELEIKLQKKY